MLGALASVGLLAVLALLYTGLSRLERRLDTVPEGAGQAVTRQANLEAKHPSIYYNGEKYIYRERLETLLILGIDDVERTESASYRNFSQPDLIVLAVFDPSDKTCTLLQLNRDTMTEVQALDSFGNVIGLEREQLALAHTYGNGLEPSCENTVDAVSRFLYGVQIDNYVALTMDAIPVLNDLVGGVTVRVEDDFSAVTDSLPMGETVLLTSENVETFVRARSSMPEPTNVNRMKRQRVYMTAFVDALRETMAKNGSFVFDAYASVSNSMVSDCSVYDLDDYAKRFSGFLLTDIRTPEGEVKEGREFLEFHANEESLQKLVLELFYQKVS